jgi:hypothetical protein
MRFVVALALAALAVLGPAQTCPAAIPGLVGAGLPVLESCCPRPAQADTAGDGARLSSACCCSIEQRAPGAPSAPVRAAHERGAPVATVVRIAIGIAAQPVTVVPAAPVLRAVAPPRTLFAQRVLLLS